MGNYASMVIEIAKKEVGYREKASNRDLDSKTSNPGYGNYTKYGRDMDAIEDFYNGHKNGYPWCDVFVDWVFVQAFGVETAKGLLCQPDDSYGAGCAWSSKYYIEKGQFHKTNPKPGDQIFFYNSRKSSAGHTGIVTKVGSGYVHTIEGNTSSSSGVVSDGGGVHEKKYPLTHSRIYGYGRPNYDEEPKKEEFKMDVLKKGAKGRQVRALQALLKGYGYNIGSSGVDGSFGGATLAAVKKFQKNNGLTVDGSVGPKTWDKLLGR